MGGGLRKVEHSNIQNKLYKNYQTPQYSGKGKHKVNHNSNSLNNMNNSIPRNSEKGALEGAQKVNHNSNSLYNMNTNTPRNSEK